MKSLWALLILGTVATDGLLKGRQSYGDSRDFLVNEKDPGLRFESIFSKDPFPKTAFQPEDIFFLSFLNGFNPPPRQQQQKISTKLPELIDDSENEIFPEDKKKEEKLLLNLFGTAPQQQKQQQPKKVEEEEVKLNNNNKNIENGKKISSFPTFKTFTDPSGQVGLEINFQAEVPDESETATKKVVELKSPPPTPVKMEKKLEKTWSTMDEDTKMISSLFNFLFPPRPKNSGFLTKPIKPQQPEQKLLVVNKCLDVTCTPPPFESTCEKATIDHLKATSKFNDLGDCCPVWFCTGPDGSFHTHYGMSRVATKFNSQNNKQGVKSSSFVQHSSSSSSSSSSNNFVPHLTFPSKIESTRPFAGAAPVSKENTKRQKQSESIINLMGRRNSPATWSFRKTRPVVQPKPSVASVTAGPLHTVDQTTRRNNAPHNFIPFMGFPFGMPFEFSEIVNPPLTGFSSSESVDPVFVSSGPLFPDFQSMFEQPNSPSKPQNPFAGWPFGPVLF